MMSHILEVTPAAMTHIKKMMLRHPGATAFRLSVKRTGCSGYMYVPEIVVSAKEGDINAYQQNDLMVYLDPKALPMLKGTTIDLVTKTLGMEQLAYRNPNTDSLCGCGESFTLKEET